jgi:8-amino-7-oxononanoate synthase
MALDWLDDELGALARDNLLRDRRPPASEVGPFVVRQGRRVLNLCSNDYLSLAGRSAIVAPGGSGASRLVGGDLEVHAQLERALARWLEVEETLVFSSGYAANLGAVAALSGPGSLVVSDALNHASLIDGCRLGRGRVVVVEHRNVEAVERALADVPERRKLVVTDGYFSMDGDVAPLAELRAVCDRHGAALYVDEAHALGVLGPGGRGACSAAGVIADVRMGTLGKSFGASGAFIAGSRALSRWLWNRARPFVFSTGISPAVAATALAALPDIEEGTRTARLHRNVAAFRGALGQAGIRVAEGSVGPIVPILVGAADRVVRVTETLLERDVFVHPIRPPTVARGTSRLRLTIQADHPIEALVTAAATIADALRT